MDRYANLADKVAKSFVAGVGIYVKGHNPLDLGWVSSQLSQNLRQFGNKIEVAFDGNSSFSDVTGTINIYVNDPALAEKVRHSAWDVVSHLGSVGIDAKVRPDVSKQRGGPVIRVDVMRNAEKGGLESTSITYSTWREILNALGLVDEDEQVGTMPIHEYLSAVSVKQNELQANNRLNRFAQQIADMARKAMTRGYKEISWG